MCCLNMGLKLYNTSKKPQVIYMTLYAESAADQTEHFANILFGKTLCMTIVLRRYESLQSTPFCLHKFNVRKWVF